MKAIVQGCLLMIGTMISTVSGLNAQTISTVNNPAAPGIFNWSGSGALSGYAGTPIVLKNKLVLEYNASGSSDPALIVLQLAVTDGVGALTLIPNPDAGQGVYFQSIQTVLHDSLFFIYLSPGGVQHLASFDGTAITLYPNPDASASGYIGSPRIFNDKLYVAYQNVAGVTQFGRFNGSGISLIPNPDASSVGFFNDYSVVFANKICSRYVSASNAKVLATFDGNSWTILPNPDNVASRGFQPVFPVEYKNKLYWLYYGVGNQFQFAVYDGVGNPGLIANPEDESSVGGGVSGFPIVLGDTLFFQYYDLTEVLHLAKFDGTTIRIVPNPDASPYGFYNTPVIYNNSLYIFYVTPDGNHHLAQYLANGLKVYPNPDGGLGYWDQPIVYNNELYFMYYNASSVLQLGHFDGSSLQVVANPSGVYNGAGGNNGYTGYPLVWNNILYMQFGSVPYANSGNLAAYTSGALPVTLLSFTAQKKGTTALLQWATSSELNSAYFSVERSTDPIHFQAIGKVTSHGTDGILQKYQFIDNYPAPGLNYYRLKQVDIDGRSEYSNIATVSFDNIGTVFKLYPNPVSAQATFSLPVSNGISFLTVFDISGKKVIEKQINHNTSLTNLDAHALAPGTYECTLIQGSKKQVLSMIKQ